MIDPHAVTNFNRNNHELEEFMLFCIVVAGKNAFQQAQKLDLMLRLHDSDTANPFLKIRSWDSTGNLTHMLRSVKMGQYERISTAFRGVANFFQAGDGFYHPLQDAPVGLLESVKGIGMKTARFFIMHTRPCQWYACLDTHILQWLGELGYTVPKQTPRGEKYYQLEQIFLQHARFLDISPAELDLKIWNERHLTK